MPPSDRDEAAIVGEVIDAFLKQDGPAVMLALRRLAPHFPDRRLKGIAYEMAVKFHEEIMPYASEELRSRSGPRGDRG